MKTLRKLYNRFFGVAGAALACKKPCYLWSVYDSPEGWMFSWTSEDHTAGEVRGPYKNEEDARWTMGRWANSNRGPQGAIITEHRSTQ